MEMPVFFFFFSFNVQTFTLFLVVHASRVNESARNLRARSSGVGYDIPLIPRGEGYELEFNSWNRKRGMYFLIHQ